MVWVGEPPVADYEPEALPNIASEDVEPRSWHAFVAPRRGWALDDFDWTVIASAFGGLVGGALADRLAQVRVLMRVICRYSLFDVALPAGARKGAR